ncbi:AraC family transcriptional regulator [Vallitalea sp.]|jgi:AraC-like DNA-binding protein|uniref:AraC family transcriptional regulator n=1 Tax=Vallitalea sp. TaxID=1882829 RepID=UPI0025F9C823|nr:helix-turn-helix domain-containing protein [Vallitalea sp.]MCT4686130.1 helix-turn-helix domain-containing protein [Vallitalea sp.]
MGIDSSVHACVRVVKDHLYHWHDNMTVVMVVAGKIKLRVWAKDNIMKSGDILVLNKGEIHKLTAITEENLVVVVTFDREFCLSACCDYKESIILCNSVKYGNRNKERYNELQLKLRDLIHEYGKTSCNCNTRKKAKEIIKFLCYHFDYISSGKNHKRFSEYIIARNKLLYKKIFLENSELSEMSLKNLSSYLGVSYAYLRIDILERFGYGFSWLKHTMMTEKAARMMLTTDKRLIDISNQCGFSDQKYLRKYIKKFYQCNPSEFRKQYKVQCEKEGYVEIPLRYVTGFCENFRRLEG